MLKPDAGEYIDADVWVQECNHDELIGILVSSSRSAVPCHTTAKGSAFCLRPQPCINHICQECAGTLADMARPTNPVKFIAELSRPNSSTAMTADKEASEALTGRILHTDTVDIGVDQQSSPKWFQKKPLEIGVVLLLLALLGTVVGLAVGLSRSRTSQGIDPACIHALGGGPVKRGGGLDSTAPEYCKEQLHAYADRNRGSYRRVSVCLQPPSWNRKLHV
jgi:hypothetical protein